MFLEEFLGSQEYSCLHCGFAYYGDDFVIEVLPPDAGAKVINKGKKVTPYG